MIKVELYSLQAVADLEKYTYGHMRELMRQVSRGQLTTWNGYGFVKAGTTWLAYRCDEFHVVVNN